MKEHVPAPEEQPACVAVSHCWILGEAELSVTQIWYHVAVEAAFQTYVGNGVAIVPDGETSVAAGGGLAIVDV